VPRDAQAALSYYGMAFDMGHWKAAYALGQLYAGNQRKQLVTITPATSSRCKLTTSWAGTSNCHLIQEF
jgi:TPR repeat protein